MPNLNIKVDRSLIIAVNVAAAKADLSQRDFVIKALAVAAGLERRDDIPQTKGQSKTEEELTEISHPRRLRVKGADTEPVTGRQVGSGETGIQVADGSPEDSARSIERSTPAGSHDGNQSGNELQMVPGEKCWCGAQLFIRPGMVTKWICDGDSRHVMNPRAKKDKEAEVEF